MTLLTLTLLRLRARALTFASLFCYLGCSHFSQNKSQPYASSGMLDLSDWDFAQDGPVTLSGEYEFYWQQHLAPGRFSQPERPQMSSFIRVPGIWNGYELDGKTLSGAGYATYRLRVRLKEPAPLSLKLLDMATAFTVYADGTKLFSAGVPGKTPEATVPQYFPQVVDFMPASGELELIFHVANFHHQKGGAWEPIKLGLPNDLQQARAKALQLDILLFGCIVIVGLYHLGLFAVRTNEPAPLYFGIFCLLIALRLIVISERLLLQFFPHINWELLGKIEYLAYYLAPPAGAMFLHGLYREDFPSFILRTIQIISAVFCVVVLFTPVRIFSHTVTVHHFYTILCCLYGVSVIILARARRREGAKINLAGFSILFLAILNDILKYFDIIHTPLLLPFGLLAFIFSQAVLLSFRFSKAFRTVDLQRLELKKANLQYEKELVERKRLEDELRASRERLRALGAHLQALLEQERVEVARNLHDELGQALTSLKMDLSVLGRQVENADGKFEASAILREIGSMQKLIASMLNKVRGLITELRPAILDTLGLVPALEWQLEEFHKRTGLAHEFHSVVKDLEIAKEHAVAVYRIFQESLANIARHAGASMVTVKIEQHDHAFGIEIVDDGKGISAEELNAPGKFGLLGMRERALVFGGEVNVTGAPGQGTTVKIKVPIPAV